MLELFLPDDGIRNREKKIRSRKKMFSSNLNVFMFVETHLGHRINESKQFSMNLNSNLDDNL